MSSVHVVVFPFPAQGHMPPMLKLAQLLLSGAAPGLHITFINTEHVHARLVRRSPDLDGLAQLPRFRFRTVPDGLPDDDPRPFHRLLELEESMRTQSREAYRELLLCSDDARRDCDRWPPVSCVVADGILSLALEVAEEVGIPVMIMRTSSACSLWAYWCIPQLIERGEVPFPEGADMDEEIQGVEGMEGIQLRRRDLPSLIRNAKSSNDRGIQYAIMFSKNLTRARALILNTFESLESSVLSRIRSTICPITYTLGPLHLLARSIKSTPSTVGLWPEDRACITWLDSQPHKSVVYISFGSSLIMSKQEVLEFFYGLMDSGQRFLWVVRPDLIEGCVGSMPAELEEEEEVKERGYFVSWAPQEEVLAHPAVGCFLTHSGWNSTMESMVAGVPMICRPFMVDQLINSRFVSEVWRVGVDMKDVRGRDAVQSMVREAMEGERADELRRSAGEVAEAARRSVEEGGTSSVNLHNLIEHVKSLGP